MKIQPTRSSAREGATSRHLAKGCLAAAFGVMAAVTWQPVACLAQQTDAGLQTGQVLTRGPVHEAFAGIIAYNSEPGIVVTLAPPENITEVPPGERPTGNNITWIPGYWAWDDERTDFVWVSGTWRALPPGREWIAGYWADAAPGYQWTSGYWADVAEKETTYLPEPPASVESGPNISAPSRDYRWTPGTWVWSSGAYAWGPGYWARGRADWDWMPAHYVWTRRGYIYVGGYWDYSPSRRGLLYAPVYFDGGRSTWRGYSYTPSVVISLGVFFDHLFLRPSYRHYYFGDYYAPNYQQGGYYSSYSTYAQRYAFDPVYTHQLWEHRQDGNWQTQSLATFQYRRDHESARPPRTWAAQQAMGSSNPEFSRNRMQIGTTVENLRSDRNNTMEFQPLAAGEQTQFARRGKEVSQLREQRQLVERKTVDPTRPERNGIQEPAKVARERSPIAAIPTANLAPDRRPPAAQRSPQVNERVKSQPGKAIRQPDATARDGRGEPQKAGTLPRDSKQQPAARSPRSAPAQPQQQPAARSPRSTPAQPQQQPAARSPRSAPAQPQQQPAARSPRPAPAQPQQQPAARSPQPETRPGPAAATTGSPQPAFRPGATAATTGSPQPETRPGATAATTGSPQPQTRSGAARVARSHGRPK